MANFLWALVCERVIIEEQHKTVSFISIVENLNLPLPPANILAQTPPPFIPFRFFIVTHWSRSKQDIGERVPGRVLLIGPNGKEFGKMEFVIDLTGAPRSRVIGQTIGIPLMGAGVYTCVVQSQTRTKWRKVGQVEFTISFIGGASGPQAELSH